MTGNGFRCSDKNALLYDESFCEEEEERPWSDPAANLISPKLDRFLQCYGCASYRNKIRNKCKDFNTSSIESRELFESTIVHTITAITGVFSGASYYCITYDREDIYTVIEDKGIISCSEGCKIPIVCSAGNSFILGEDLRVIISKHQTM